MFGESNGWLCMNPEVLFNKLLLQYQYGLTSLRRTVEEASVNIDGKEQLELQDK